MRTRSKGTPRFGLLIHHRRGQNSAVIDTHQDNQSPVRENPIFETNFESSSSDSEAESMAENNDHAPPVEKFGDTVKSGVDHPGNFAYATDNISIPPHYISLVNGGTLFHGREDEEPISHLNAFYELTMNHRPANVPHDNIKRALFPFSLRDKAREWYDSLPGYNVATFEDLKSKFLLEYNSPMKIERLRDAITSFRQQDDESFR
ncbi:uncharacterized protein LOC121754585 [Salvia splendens]|uniref:uncharacterized protein LOC121754585 n=1 Tax=Salvia splendens TaxID=180675 RepID=UPI001C271807|nr:uncharacterized protein LOC121754585 [Salvia splendens]